MAKLKKKSSYSKVMWSLIFVIIAAASILMIVSQSRDFTFQGFWEYIKNASPLHVIFAIASMLGFVVFEGLALIYIAKNFGYRQRFFDGLVYSASDIYLSSITPSATGGQPASAYFMMQNQIPGAVATVILLLNLMMYALAIIVVGFLSFLLRPGIFLSFGTFSKLLIIVGCVVQFGLVLLFWLLLKKEKILFGFFNKILSFLEWIRVVKKRQKYEKKLEASMIRYRECAKMIAGKRKMLLVAFLFNLLQRLSIIMVTVFAYLGTGGTLSHALDIGVTQCYVYLGSNSIPIPGAIGVSDYILLDGLGKFVEDPTHLELFSRSLSFYFCVIFCGLFVLVTYLIGRKKHRKKANASSDLQ